MVYKAVFIPRVGQERAFEQEFVTLEEAEAAMTAIANYTLFLHEVFLMPDYSNCGMVLRKDGDDWIEVDGEGEEI
ncbi:hypothetical protein KAR91_36205 [Candidatus Pacearchaeota archaeon]|nr:hypothetical protein [Candidatus Pacearchaeota archaeon]